MTVVWTPEAFRRQLQSAMLDGVTAAAMAGADTAARSFQRLGGMASAPGTPPATQSGHLRNSVTHTRAVIGANDRPTATYGTNVPYGRYLEFGANPRPRRGKYLAVPLNRAARRALVGSGGSVRALDLVAIRSRRGNVVLTPKSTARRGKIEPWFVLRKSVLIAPRPWLRPSLVSGAGRMQRVFVTATRRSMQQRGLR